MRSNPRTPTGIRLRHSRSCATSRDGRCNCKPSYEAAVWSKRDGKKLRETFPTLAAARAWRHDASSAVRKGTLRAPTATTLRDAWSVWLSGAEKGEILNRNRRPYKPSVLRSYAQDMNLYVLDDYGAHRLGDIRPDDVQALIDSLVGAGLSGSRCRNVINPLRALYRRHRREVALNPTRDLDLPEAGGTREWHGTPEHARALIAALSAEDRALWATAFYAGPRRGELRALRVRDLHGLNDEVGERWIDIGPDGNWDDKEGRIAPKYAASVRWTLMPETLRILLRTHVRRTGRSEGDLMFGSTASTPFSPSDVRERALEAWEAAGLDPVTLHQCRHGFASFLDAAGVSETRSDRYLGHARKTTGDRYRHRLHGQLSEDAKTLDAYLNRSKANVVALPSGAHSGAQQENTA
jgi:integrase